MTMAVLFTTQLATALLALVGRGLCSDPYSSDPAVGPIVKTTSGSVRGYYPHSTVRAFLGISYAEPPVGNLRFKPPVPLKPADSSKVLDATRFGYSCIQAHPLVPAVAWPSTGENEDCLTLNIWTSASTSKELKPVFIWLPGGGFVDGSTSIPLYEGFDFVKTQQDIIVVTVNWRLNIFGFANSPGLREKNAGLRDQRLAVEWLRDNIAAFGGDPKRLILAGESAGSMSADMYSYAYADDPIVQAFIEESGQGFSLQPDDRTQWKEVANKTGCLSDDATKEFECMQTEEPIQLRRALSKYNVIPLEEVVQAKMAIDNITYFGPQGYIARAKAGQFTKLPVLRGSNNNEGNGVTPFTVDGPVNATASDFATLFAFTCTTALASLTWSAYGIPSWRYRFTARYPTLAIYDWMGSYHGAEIALVFGTTRAVQVGNPQPYEIAGQRYIQEAWAAFIKDPYKGLLGFGWPMYNPNSSSLVELFTNNSVTAAFVNPTTYDRLCGF